LIRGAEHRVNLSRMAVNIRCLKFDLTKCLACLASLGKNEAVLYSCLMKACRRSKRNNVICRTSGARWVARGFEEQERESSIIRRVRAPMMWNHSMRVQCGLEIRLHPPPVPVQDAHQNVYGSISHSFDTPEHDSKSMRVDRLPRFN
jgi:hypothetical protein